MEWFREMVLTKIDYDRIHFEVLESNNILASLEKYTEKQNAGMIAMLERIHRGVPKNLFQRGKVKQMASRNQLPLLSFNERNLQALFF
jgi:hypothetical protein